MSDDNNDQKQKKNPDRRTELLIADMNNANASFLFNEEAGERRVQFFIGLLTAVIAVLGVFGVEAIKGPANNGTTPAGRAAEALLSTQSIAAAFMVALGILLAFGFLTFLRIVKRDCVTEEYKAISSYRRKLLKLDDPFDVVKEIDDSKSAATKVKAGGLAQMLVFINGVLLILISMLALIVWPAPEDHKGVLIGISALISLHVGWQLSQWSKNRRKAYSEALEKAFERKLSLTR